MLGEVRILGGLQERSVGNRSIRNDCYRRWLAELERIPSAKPRSVLRDSPKKGRRLQRPIRISLGSCLPTDRLASGSSTANSRCLFGQKRRKKARERLRGACAETRKALVAVCRLVRAPRLVASGKVRRGWRDQARHDAKNRCPPTGRAFRLKADTSTSAPALAACFHQDAHTHCAAGAPARGAEIIDLDRIQGALMTEIARVPRAESITKCDKMNIAARAIWCATECQSSRAAPATWRGRAGLGSDAAWRCARSPNFITRFAEDRSGRNECIRVVPLAPRLQYPYLIAAAI